MKIATFSVQTEQHIGLVKDDQIISLTALCPEEFPACIKKFIERGSELRSRAEQIIEQRVNDDAIFKLSEVNILPPIAKPDKIICVGLNYFDHCKESGMEPPESPVIFSKYANAIAGHNDAIEIPINSTEVDFEAELAFVIGREAKRVSEEEADDYVFGYTIMNDISARDLQFQDGQWSRGKTADTFAPFGPVIVTKDEVGDPHNLAISLELNGEIMQDSNTSNLIFTVPKIISFLSQSMTLMPGDLIATGTPPGVGMGRNPKIWLKNGDRMNVSIEKIGTLSNHVIA
ncbi:MULTISPECIES: fumarylacetoacetate hydrolase family protein [Bacillaceae]|uniref:2-hydroxyhepta-2,4-diene-1,7-dioate isomerase n=1 Tax=Peribacillus simplex TaxID=1478 RepID=A0AAN2PIQ7_9BACI|nr:MULTISPECIES: fumarylacetoacetate hydrolase family protein [Bacillaceae]MCP1094625.1 fumarylacetoacetate hydrolase family protein [Bacillaceae bacterium OS4b]MCF7622840.1 fumarylacetoacetate hydrolase family protein [Peribacillus frigoritolerans]MCP1153385.1 fumarylacetoacetate hydrolase family protein [Peribacillus frigoritolerans]MEA3573339.1 fumarylacetoacetate hydrolase family protein [Peribacillus frigoritolerans]NCT38056.1 fumarylacetoacetate hydrolase family protein [Peribacillus fri